MCQWSSISHLFSDLFKCVYSFTTRMLLGPAQAVWSPGSGTIAVGKNVRLIRDSSEVSAVEVGRKQRDTDVLPVCLYVCDSPCSLLLSLCLSGSRGRSSGASFMPVLRYCNIMKPVTIQSDSSQSGLGCCLMQEGQRVAFASRALTPTEQNYLQIEKECLSILFSCQLFHHYLYSHELITIETDHKPLISISSKPLFNAPKRHTPDSKLQPGDTLSRATAQCIGGGMAYQRDAICSLQQEPRHFKHINQADYITDCRLAQIRQYTDKDEHLQSLKPILLTG